MTALAEAGAGLALVMCFALLCVGQLRAAAMVLAVQSAAVALSAVVLHRPLMALPPFALAGATWIGGIWLVRQQTLAMDSRIAPVGRAKLGAGALLAILCQSQGSLALPLAIVLLSILVAATRPHPLMQLMALVSTQNGVALAVSLVAQPVMFPATLLVPVACLVLPLPLAAGLLVPVIPASPYRRAMRLARARLAHTQWLEWTDLGLAFAMFAATLIVPLDSLASIFAPLLGLDGVLQSCVRRNRLALAPLRRGAALAQSGFTVLAACSPNLMVAWLAVVGAMANALLPTLSRRWDSAVLAFFAAGLALLGILLLSAKPSILGYFSLFGGFTMIAAIASDIAVVLVIVILRLAGRAPWPPDVEALGSGIAVIALLACALLLTNRVRSRTNTLLLLSQASIAALIICIGESEGRFAALVLLILLILTRSAARFPEGPAAALARAGLAGVPPLGVFPGLVLVVLTMTGHEPWFLLPLSAALIPIELAGFPGRFPDFSPRRTAPSIAWLPLLLALLVGYFTPDSLVHWWRIVTAGRT